jgi:hypothetical protein
LPQHKPAIITVPKQKFFAIKGAGDPNGRDFSEKVSVLYSLAYAIRMMPKSAPAPEGYFEYTVYPLEGVWSGGGAIPAPSLMSETVPDKSSFVYTIMIRQPDFVTCGVAQKAFETVGKKKPHEYLPEAFFCEVEDGLAVQMLHVGDYDDEPRTFAEMQNYIEANNLSRRDDTHREIYLTDANRTARNKMKTVLRFTVACN